MDASSKWAETRRIRATADRQVTVIKADATGESERTRGDGDAERNRIYAEAYNKDPEFFGFYRSMQAYEIGLGSGDTRMLLSPDSEFFQYFNSAFGNAVQNATPSPATPPSAPRCRRSCQSARSWSPRPACRI